MKIRLGIIGVEDNLKLMESVAKEYSEFITFPYLHSTLEEIFDILQTHQYDVDMWLFSGYLPYSVARQWGKVDKPMFFITYTGSCLYKSLYHALYENRVNFNELSFDCFAPNEITQIAEELGVSFNPDYLKQYDKSTELIVEHHYELWKNGKTKAAVTSIWRVSNELKKMGVPVFRVNPTKNAIQSAMNVALRTNEMLLFKERQIAVQLLESVTLSGLAIDLYSSDEYYHKELQITQKLLKYTKKVQGSLKKVGPGRYIIFSTRGALSKITKEFTAVPDLEEIQQLSQRSVTCGIGIGQSAYEAEIHAGKALLHAKEYGNGTWMVLFDNKKISGPIGNSEKSEYSYESTQFQTISEQTSLSVSTISKIDSILNTIGKTEITAHDLAQHMQIIPRSARRIIDQLMKKGFAKEIAEETSHPRGRPRKIYQITL
ncbi:ArsR family transcriptional regulator [Brevibacillus choshinensis]|uniref:ArsR family transcriptional regulator n=1 Tax=Brevibacillus choshinensis TaxID=54911 RepID=UPI002E1C351B|nr:ArsR family transcriptional regulator [Brevibacillus choshinensis]